MVGEAETGNAGEQPARNNQPETHQVDERGRGHGAAPSQATGYLRTSYARLDRSPYA